MSVSRCAVFCLVMVTLFSPPVLAQDRVALVVGISDYEDFPLRNPVNDAQDISRKLRRFGFDVTELNNVDRRGFTQAIRDFSRKLSGEDKVGLFFYAGHAVEVSGQNYLIPLGTDIRAENDVEYEAVNAGRVLTAMERAGNGLNLVILDSCRDNPYSRRKACASRRQLRSRRL